MKWGSPDLVVLFLLIPALILFLRERWKARLAALDSFGNPNLVEKLIDSVDRGKQIGKMTLMVAAFFFLILALVRPQFGTKTRQVHRLGQDIVIALDLSDSMLAEDFPRNRLDKAKQEIKSFLDLLEGDRVGLIGFAGEAQVLCPLTLDYGAAELFLMSDEVNTHWVPTPGTNISEAIKVSAKCFRQDEQKHKNIILITDGESHEGDPVGIAEEVSKGGVTIYTIGIGKPEGVPIPVLDKDGRKTYKKDKDGNIITTKLDIETLQQIAAKTGGRWRQATGGQLELGEIYDEIREQEDKELEASVTTIYEDRFQIPLIIGLVLLLIEMVLSDRKKKGSVERVEA
jgi:Ca-activated chloride channel family protein